MASKISGKSRSHSEGEINKLREKNTYSRMTLDEVSHQKGAPSDSQDNYFYLEIRDRDQEIISLWHMLQSDIAEVMTSLHTQINQLRAEAETQFHCLKQETDEVKKKLEAVLEHSSKSTAEGQTTTGNSTLIQEQLIDALEKNKQWLMYDQQREAYVKAMLAEKCILELELYQAKNTLLQKEIYTEETEMEIQQCYEKIVGKLKREQQKVQQLLTEHHQIRKELVKERLKSAELQQRIQLSAKNLEDVSRDNKHLQLQHQRVLKELRKALKKVETLESEKAQRLTS